jgi:hypothetical protein
MNKDTELTRMNNAYNEIWGEITRLIDDCINTKGQLCAAHVMHNLATEISARSILSTIVILNPEDANDVVKNWIGLSLARYEELATEAERLGLMDRGEK